MMVALLFLCLGSATGFEVSLLQSGEAGPDPKHFSTIIQPKETETDTIRFKKIGEANRASTTKLPNYDFEKPDPAYPITGTYSAVEDFKAQATYRDTTPAKPADLTGLSGKALKTANDAFYTSSPFWTSGNSKSAMNKESKFAKDKLWEKKIDKKFLTSGTIGYNWKFHEMTEKAYSKVVAKVAEGGVEKTKNTTVSKLENKNEQVKQSIDSTDTTKEDSKVFKGKALLQTKAVQDVTTTTSDEGYDRTKFEQGSSTEGKIGSQHGKTSGTYTNTAGGTFTSVMEMPKVTAKKTGSVDVEWRGGDTYTTSKMMAGMKKFIKRASRGESW